MITLSCVKEGNDLSARYSCTSLDLIKKYDIIDFDLGIKLTGAGFPVYKGKGAKLERALINYFLDEGVKAGYWKSFLPLW